MRDVGRVGPLARLTRVNLKRVGQGVRKSARQLGGQAYLVGLKGRPASRPLWPPSYTLNSAQTGMWSDTCRASSTVMLNSRIMSNTPQRPVYSVVANSEKTMLS